MTQREKMFNIIQGLKDLFQNISGFFSGLNLTSSREETALNQY